MQNNLKANIHCIEDKWLQILSLEIDRFFTGIFMPSHNLQHHLRVWNFAKELLDRYSLINSSFSIEYIEALMIAVFFHDAGLTITIGPEHGEEGSKLAQIFLKKYESDWNNCYTPELLDAIIKHDDKTYSSVSATSDTLTIYKTLTIADDLDAFGCLGLLRYLEIYFQRGISISEILPGINKNVHSRFDFVSSELSNIPEYLPIQEKRFNKGLLYIKKLDANQLGILKSFSTNYIDPLSTKNIAIPDNIVSRLIREAKNEGLS